MKIAIFYKKEKEDKELINSIKQEAKKHQIIIDNENPDVVISVGGDGTFLRAVHQYIDYLDKVVFIGVNNGSLGFFYDFFKEEVPELLSSLAKKELVVKEYPLLQGDVIFKNSQKRIYAVNEIRVECPFHTLISDVFINDEKLEVYRGNGLIVSTTLGSSAYNKSLGGALIDPDLFALELTEVAGIQNNVYRSLDSSLVIDGHKQITFTGSFKDSIVVYDYLNIPQDDELKEIKLHYSEKKAKIIYRQDHSYVQRIRKSFVL